MRTAIIKTAIAAIGICALGTAAFAQTDPLPGKYAAHLKPSLTPGNTLQNQPPPGGFPPDPPAEQGVCPPSGYAPPTYIVGGTVNEIASPCNPQEVRDLAEAMGMGRYRPIGIKVILTIGWSAKGTINAPLGLGDQSTVTVGMNYLTDSARFFVQRQGQSVTHVVSDGKAYDETLPGVGYKAGTPADAAMRSPLLKLTPFGAVLSIVEAEGHATIKKVGNKTIFTGASPYDNIPITLTVGPRNLPEKVEFKAGGHSYTATWSEYGDLWEPNYFYIFPERQVWTMDGKPLADLTTTSYKSNPYVVFPPAEVLQMAAARGSKGADPAVK